MDQSVLYLILKTLHVMGFVLATGVTFSRFMAYTQFWNLYSRNRDQALAALRSFSVLQRAGMIALLIDLFAGLGMLAWLDWVLTNNRWFQIKLALIALIFLNGFTLARTSTLKLEAFLSDSEPFEKKAEDIVVRGRLRT